MTTPEKHPLEILAPDGPHETIIAAEEKAAPMADVAAFAEALKGFTREDYCGDAPYDLLVRSSQYAWNQFDQFAAVLINAAVKTGMDEKDVKEAVALFRYLYVESAGEASDILSAIRLAAEDEEHADKVSVLSIPCGSGLIIVTDSIDRMDEYWKPGSTNPGFDDALLHFISRHKERVAVINSKNYDTMRSRQYYAPVVVLTTQRYFSWTPERVKEMLHWEGGTRPLIIFDEAPYLSEERAVTVETINMVATALRMGIEAAEEERRAEKYRAIEMWEQIRARLLAEMDELEYTPGLQYAYIAAKEDVTLDDFLAYVREHHTKLDADKKHITQMVEDIAQLLTGWGVYSHRSIAATDKYESKYTVHADHRDLVTDIGAKVIVLDGTAGVSPIYDEDYLHMVPARDFARSLSCLTIRLCDVPTGEQDLRDNAAATAKMILGYLANATQRDRALVVFSNQKLEKAFRSLGFDKEHTGHFNNIKGLNTYGRALNIAQIGLNRKPPVEYMTLDLARKDDIREQLAEETIAAGPVAPMGKARESMDYSVGTMTRHVLADMEQNLYRGAIRNAANTKPFTYYVFFDHASYQPLIAAIRERYEPLGSTVEVVERGKVEAYRPQGAEAVRVALIEKWLDQWDGTAIRQKDIYKKLGMERMDFNNALACPAGRRVKARIDAAKQQAKVAGLKTGWMLGKSVSPDET